MKAPAADGPGLEYATFLKALAKNSPEKFICHFYNVYFAHSAGGKMIGRKVSEMILDGKELEFYKWAGEGTCWAFPKSRLHVCAYKADTLFYLSLQSRKKRFRVRVSDKSESSRESLFVFHCSESSKSEQL
jgi:hypothetical protein